MRDKIFLKSISNTTTKIAVMYNNWNFIELIGIVGDGVVKAILTEQKI